MTVYVAPEHHVARRAVMDVLQAFVRVGMIRRLDITETGGPQQPLKTIVDVQGLNIDDFTRALGLELMKPGILETVLAGPSVDEMLDDLIGGKLPEVR